MAILLALASFDNLIRGRKVVLYTDKGAEGTTKKGSAKAIDHNALIHAIWVLALELKTHLWIERVPSKLNLADSPSRYEFEVMEDIGGKWVHPRLPAVVVSHDD